METVPIERLPKGREYFVMIRNSENELVCKRRIEQGKEDIMINNKALLSDIEPIDAMYSDGRNYFYTELECNNRIKSLK